MFAAARAEREAGLAGGGGEAVADGGAQVRDDEALAGEVAVVEQRQQCGVARSNS